MPKIVFYQTASVWFVKNDYFMAKIDVCRSLLPSDRVIGWDIKMTSYPNSNASFINIWDRLIRRQSPNLTRSSKLAAAPNWSLWHPATSHHVMPNVNNVPGWFLCNQVQAEAELRARQGFRGWARIRSRAETTDHSRKLASAIVCRWRRSGHVTRSSAWLIPHILLK